MLSLTRSVVGCTGDKPGRYSVQYSTLYEVTVVHSNVVVAWRDTECCRLIVNEPTHVFYTASTHVVIPSDVCRVASTAGRCRRVACPTLPVLLASQPPRKFPHRGILSSASRARVSCLRAALQLRNLLTSPVLYRAIATVTYHQWVEVTLQYKYHKYLIKSPCVL